MPVFPASWISGLSTVTHATSDEDICLSGPITLGSRCNNSIGVLFDIRIEVILCIHFVYLTMFFLPLFSLIW